MPCKFRIDLEDYLKGLEESLKRYSFEFSKYDLIRDRKLSRFQWLSSFIRRTKEEIKLIEEKISSLAEEDSDLVSCQALDKVYEETLKENPKIKPIQKSDKELAEDLFKELGI
jgi:hypothetical protein